MALSSLPDLLQSPVGRPRVELPVALPEARPACKYHEIVKCDPQAMSLHNDFVELQDFIPQHIIQLADTHVSSKWALSSLATSELGM